MFATMMRLKTRIIGVFFLVMLSCSCIANTVLAPPHIKNEMTQPQLWGQGTYSWFGFKVYDAQLWAGESGIPSGLVASTKFVLDLQYARNLDGASIAEASIKEMQKIGAGNAQQHQQWLAKMKNIFPDVTKGAHLSGVYLPDQGARFYLNEKLLGEVTDPAFARAFFGIWLDPKTSDRKLRSALLAGPMAGPTN